MQNNPIAEIVRFQTDRSLHLQEYDALNEHTNILEELVESIGFDVPKENRPELTKRWEYMVMNLALDRVMSIKESDEVDAYVDIIVFAIGGIMKLGYEPTLSLLEGAKEINSRVGKMIDGKFEKDLSPEAKVLWYKADYNKCKLN